MVQKSPSGWKLKDMPAQEREPGHIVVVGSANMDYVVPVKRLPVPGETVPGGDLVTSFGGKGANAAVAAARLGGKVRLIGCVGEDAAGGEYLAHLTQQGVDISAVRRVSGRPTGSALIFVDEHGENMIAVAPGANHALGLTDIEAAVPLIREASVLLCQFEMPLECVRAAIEVANDADVRVILNPSPMSDRFNWEAVLIDYLVLNAGEAQALTGRQAPEIDNVRSRGRSGNTIVTRGALPTLFSGIGGVGEIAAFPVNCVDTVGAGDTFVGALAVAVAEGRALPESVKFANAAAALSTTKVGAQVSMPSRAEVEGFWHAPKGKDE